MIIALILISIFHSTFSIKPVVASPKTWKVDDDGIADFSTIQDAVNAASPGDTVIIRAGAYTENVNVNKDHLIIKSEGGAEVTVVQAANPNDHVFEVTANYISICGVTVKGATGTAYYAGICLYYNVKHCDISNNVASNNNVGIYLDHACENTLTGNIANFNNYDGIYLNYAADNTLINNVASNNSYYGIYLGSPNVSSPNTLNNNMMSNNRMNFQVIGPPFIHNIDMSNKVDGKPIYYWINKQNQQVPSDAGYVGLVNCINITVKDLNLTNNGQGVLLDSTTNSRVENVNASNNGVGIELWFSDCNNLTNTINLNNGGSGISLYYSFNNVLANNVVNLGGYGFAFYCSSSNILASNIANSNTGSGIFLYRSSYNILTNVTNSDNYCGIELCGSSSNTITNNIASNSDIGIYLTSFSNDNNIYFNNFLKNTNNVYSDSINIWHSPEQNIYIYSGKIYTNYLGNYWGDYTGNDADGDGIGDTPYSIDGDKDYYPLMKSFENYCGWLFRAPFALQRIWSSSTPLASSPYATAAKGLSGVVKTKADVNTGSLGYTSFAWGGYKGFFNVFVPEKRNKPNQICKIETGLGIEFVPSFTGNAKIVASLSLHGEGVGQAGEGALDLVNELLPWNIPFLGPAKTLFPTVATAKNQAFLQVNELRSYTDLQGIGVASAIFFPSHMEVNYEGRKVTITATISVVEGESIAIVAGLTSEIESWGNAAMVMKIEDAQLDYILVTRD
jgi:parallel beta-helix repeat protein